jgi:hydrogenase expression/formation protein HypC
MCLAIPLKVESLDSNDYALVSLGKVQQKVCISLIDNVKIGDYLIVHVGTAIQKVNEEEAQKTLEILNAMYDM